MLVVIAHRFSTICATGKSCVVDNEAQMIEDRLTVARLKKGLLEENLVPHGQKCEIYRRTFFSGFSSNFACDMDACLQSLLPTAP